MTQSPIINWRSSTERLQQAATIINRLDFQEMMGVVYSEHPMRSLQAPKDGCDSTWRLGEIAGFQKALNILLSLKDPLPIQPQQIEATFGAENESNEPS